MSRANTKNQEGFLILASGVDLDTITIDSAAEVSDKQRCPSCHRYNEGKREFEDYGDAFAEWLYDNVPGGFWDGLAPAIKRIGEREAE